MLSIITQTTTTLLPECGGIQENLVQITHSLTFMLLIHIRYLTILITMHKSMANILFEISLNETSNSSLKSIISMVFVSTSQRDLLKTPVEIVMMIILLTMQVVLQF